MEKACDLDGGVSLLAGPWWDHRLVDLQRSRRGCVSVEEAAVISLSDRQDDDFQMEALLAKVCNTESVNQMF